MLMRTARPLIFLLFLTSSAIGEVAVLPLRAPTGNLTFPVAADSAIQITLSAADEREQWRARLDAERGIQLWQRDAEDERLRKYTGPATQVADSATPGTAETMMAKLRPHEWTIYLGEGEVLRVPAAFAPASVEVEAAGITTTAFRFQKVAPFVRLDGFMGAEGEGVQPLADWEILSGDWAVRSVMDDALEQRTSKNLQKKPLDEERSPNFYSLLGKAPAEGIAEIATGYPFADNYEAAVSIFTAPGAAGLTFLHSTDDRLYRFELRIPERNGENSRAVLSREGAGDREFLQGAEFQCQTGQWIRLRVAAGSGRLRCYVDHTCVIDVNEALPPGGKAGLFVRDGAFRFDDFRLASLEELWLDSHARLRYHALELEELKPLKLTRAPDGVAIESRGGGSWVVGSEDDAAHPFAATFEVGAEDCDVGILHGCRASNRAHSRFRVVREGTQETYFLERVIGPMVRVVAGWERARTASDTLRLWAEPYADHVRFYANDELVLVHEGTENSGASGLYVRSSQPVSVLEISYRLQPTKQWRNKYEKNRVFEKDPYMRHWSSPEGEWSHFESQTWHKSDFLGRLTVHVPIVAAGTLHLGVGEESDEAELQFRASQTLVSLAVSEADEPLFQQALPQGAKRLSVDVDGFFLEVRADDAVVHRHQLSQPLRGRRLRIDGYSNLTQLAVDRYGVQDTVFNKAPTDWLINGGKWQIINRFQCDPRWSHMNGHNLTGLAAIWSKYRFSGDFCVEVYAGMRHGYYERCGDLNVTMHGSRNSPSMGYTATCGEWDPEHTQLWSRLYRAGEQLDESDTYAVPRRRDGNVRKARHELEKTGRDVHGAWYYLKMRRVDGTLTYSFDNEQLLEAQDGEPLEDGAFGFWTFMNSVMVSRINVAAEGMTPQRIGFRRIPAHELEDIQTVAPAEMSLTGVERLVALVEDDWASTDDVARARVAWAGRLNSLHPPAATVTNVLGSGEFSLDYLGDSVAVADVVGFLFTASRSDDALFNFHFDLGEGKRTDRYVQRLCGAEIADSRLKLLGHTEVGLREEVDVTVWLPSSGTTPETRITNIQFGNREPGLILSGLKGNRPGASYTIAGFTPILTAPPRLVQEWFDVGEISGVVTSKPESTLTTAHEGLEQASDHLATISQPGLNRFWVRVVGPGGHMTRQIAWLEEKAGISVFWDPEVSDAFLIEGESRVQARAKLVAKVAGKKVELEPLGPMQWRGRLDDEHFEPGGLPVKLSWQDGSYADVLSWQRRPNLRGPVLQSLDGLTKHLVNFDAMGQERVAYTAIARKAPRGVADSAHLSVCNGGRLQRLRAQLATQKLNLASHPILQFRYRADPTASVSLRAGNREKIQLSEPVGATVPFSHQLLGDREWHTWTGIVAQTPTAVPYSSNFYSATSVGFGSYHKLDQTGPWSTLDLDDLVFGPAVSDALNFTPRYFDYDGVETVQICVWPGLESIGQLTTEQLTGLQWETVINDEPHDRALVDLADGVYQLYLRAIDTGGRQSQITCVPFLVDRTAPTATVSRETPDDPLFNGKVLTITWDIGTGAPVDIAKLELLIGTWKVALSKHTAKLEITGTENRLTVDWIRLLRHRIDAGKFPETLKFVGMQDGAGNRIEDLEVVLSKPAQDEMPPTWLTHTFSDDVFRLPWPQAFSEVYPFRNEKNSAEIKTIHIRRMEPSYRQVATGEGNKMSLVSRTFPEKSQYVSFWWRVLDGDDAPTLDVEISAGSGKENLQVWPVAGDHAEHISVSTRPVLGGKEGWRLVTIDVSSVIPKAKRIRQISFRTPEFKKKQVLEVRSLYVHSGWNEKSELTVDGFDQSGIEHVLWRLYDADGTIIDRGKKTEHTFKLAELCQSAEPGQWLDVQFVDFAGNKSAVVSVPAILAAQD
ncbi:MAG TPA: hypothetical protein DCR55_15495 [Lentisphaeria bacterium]|nr:hypothetical protein [Lentisphaeria bacterium]